MNISISKSSPLGERLGRIDGILGVWAESLRPPVVVVYTTTWTITVTDITTRRRAAIVRGCLWYILISFHDIHFPAPDSANLVGVTVVVTTCWRIWTSPGCVARHGDHIESSIAGAADWANVNVKGYSFTLQVVHLEAARVIIWLVVNVSSRIMR